MIWTLYSHVLTQDTGTWWTCDGGHATLHCQVIIMSNVHSWDDRSPCWLISCFSSSCSLHWTSLERDEKVSSFVVCFVFHQGLSCRQLSPGSHNWDVTSTVTSEKDTVDTMTPTALDIEIMSRSCLAPGWLWLSVLHSRLQTVTLSWPGPDWLYYWLVDMMSWSLSNTSGGQPVSTVQ